MLGCADVSLRGVVVNFDLGERFPRPRSRQRGSLRPRARCVAVLEWVREGVAPSRLGGPGRAFQFAIRFDSIRYANLFETIRFVKNRPFDSLVVMQFLR